MEQYNIYLLALIALNAGLAYYRHQSEKNAEPKETLALPLGDGKGAATKFKWEYFSVYALVVAADWLQVSLRVAVTKEAK